MTNETDIIHRIRLKGPWEAAFVADDMQFERIHVPINWRDAFGELPGTVCFRRKFHAPTGLSANNTVQIRIPTGTGTVSDFLINGEVLAAVEHDPLLFDITNHLQPFGEIEFHITFDPTVSSEIPGGLWEAVYLEIVASSET